LLFVVYWAGKRGLADVVAQPARYEINRWRTGQMLPGQLRRDAILAELQQALRLDPANPNLLEDLGRFHAARVEWGAAQDPFVRATRQQSLASYSQAVAYRPTSGPAYAGVAVMKLALGEIDREFSTALEQAHRRSPSDPQLQLLIIELGLASWQALSDENRLMLKDAIRTQAQWKLVQQKPKLTALLDRYKRPDLACLLDPAPGACDAS
jgi:tetratricopeptide (TPR) repeat protein